MNYEKLEVHVYENGNVYYHDSDGRLHNPVGPSITYPTGYQVYIIHGKWHNENGPARIWPDGTVEYWINGVQLTEEQFFARKNSCAGKTIVLDGKEYTLVPKE